ncbi:hypothetical protein BDC45DRAFT_504598 [Circinella umbellata]|nr:hypothetical protein BDC45DRAFT_504598 [Circinella umbellata]
MFSRVWQRVISAVGTNSHNSNQKPNNSTHKSKIQESELQALFESGMKMRSGKELNPPPLGSKTSKLFYDNVNRKFDLPVKRHFSEIDDSSDSSDEEEIEKPSTKKLGRPRKVPENKIYNHVLQYYCPFKGCEGVAVDEFSLINLHIRDRHFPTFYLGKQKARLKTTSGQKLCLDDKNCRGSLSKYDSIFAIIRYDQIIPEKEEDDVKNLSYFCPYKHCGTAYDSFCKLSAHLRTKHRTSVPCQAHELYFYKTPSDQQLILHDKSCINSMNEGDDIAVFQREGNKKGIKYYCT